MVYIAAVWDIAEVVAPYKTVHTFADCTIQIIPCFVVPCKFHAFVIQKFLHVYTSIVITSSFTVSSAAGTYPRLLVNIK